MIKVISKRSEETCVCPIPPSAYNAEIVLDEDGETLYIHVCIHTEAHYTLAKKSIYNYMTNKTEDCNDFDFLEEYDELEEAEESKYYKYYKMADEMIDKLIGM